MSYVLSHILTFYKVFFLAVDLAFYPTFYFTFHLPLYVALSLSDKKYHIKHPTLISVVPHYFGDSLCMFGDLLCFVRTRPFPMDKHNTTLRVYCDRGMICIHLNLVSISFKHDVCRSFVPIFDGSKRKEWVCLKMDEHGMGYRNKIIFFQRYTPFSEPPRSYGFIYLYIICVYI